MCGGNGKPTDTVVTLTVNTTGITETNRNDMVTFSDNQSDPAENPGHPETYLSTVNKGAKITWVGASVNGTDVINITSVVKKQNGGADILKSIGGPLKGSDGKDTVTAVVTGQPQTGEETYTVSFNINGGTTVYPMDPRLKMN